MDTLIANRIVIVTGLPQAIAKIKKYAATPEYQSMGPQFNLTMGENGYTGEFRADIDFPLIAERLNHRVITILQQGTYSPQKSLSLERNYLAFRDIINMDNEDNKEKAISELKGLVDERIERIEGWASSSLGPFSQPIVYIEFHSNSRYFVSTRAEKGFNYGFTVHKKRVLRDGEDSIGEFRIIPEYGNHPLFYLLENLFLGGKPEAVFFRYGDRDKQTLPYDHEKPFSLSDFAYYSLLRSSPELRLVNDCQNRVASAKIPSEDEELPGGLDFLVEHLSIDSTAEIQPLVLDTALDTQVVKNNNPDYQLLVDKSTQAALTSLNKFLEDNKDRFEPTLDALEARKVVDLRS